LFAGGVAYFFSILNGPAIGGKLPISLSVYVRSVQIFIEKPKIFQQPLPTFLRAFLLELPVCLVLITLFCGLFTNRDTAGFDLANLGDATIRRGLMKECSVRISARVQGGAARGLRGK
jgi:hypothetical protein